MAKKKAPAKKAAKKAAPKKAKKAAKKAAPKKAKKSGSGRRGGGAAFMKPMTPDDALAAVVGSGAKPRTEITKQFWAYVKSKRLQDKKTINCDDAISKLAGGKRSITMFDIPKLINAHIS